MSPHPTYTIKVKNHTGRAQDYFLFSEPASVSGDASNDIWSNVMKTLKTPKNGVATFELYRTYYAICGTFDADPEHGGKISVYKTQPVTIGTGEGASMGSTVKFSVLPDGGACDLDTAVTPGEGKIGSFVVDTSDDFTTEDANKCEHCHPLSLLPLGNAIGLLVEFIIDDPQIITLSASQVPGMGTCSQSRTRLPLTPIVDTTSPPQTSSISQVDILRTRALSK